jgi:RNA polymerase sigma factor (sigma-70 family)
MEKKYNETEMQEDREIATRVYMLHFTKFKSMKDDLIQSAIIKLWKAREAMCLIRDYTSYAFRIAKNAMRDYVRVDKNHLTDFSIDELNENGISFVDEITSEPLFLSDSIQKNLYERILQNEIKFARLNLDEKTNTVIDLYLQNKLQKEIAGMLGMSTASVSRCVREFRNHVNKERSGW